MPSKQDAKALDFVLGFVDNSRRFKSQYIDTWTEVLENYMVTPESMGKGGTTDRPYRNNYGTSRKIILKDGETHKAVMTYATRLALTLLGDSRNEYIKARPVGWEDAPTKSPTVSRLLRYCLGLPGQFRAMVEAIIDMMIFGTAIVEIPWRYRAVESLVRSQEEEFPGIEVPSFVRGTVAKYNDPYISVVDNADFFPDPSEYILENMLGAAKRFKVTAPRARSNALWDEAKVKEAISRIGKMEGGRNVSNSEDDFREDVDQPRDRDTMRDFTPMTGFEYWGEVPWNDDAAKRRVITVLNGVVVRNDDYPLADPDLPWRALVINPSVGRFYGKSPAEVIRWSQSLQDAVMRLQAEAIIRQVKPPIAYDPDSELEEERLRAWSVDTPIPIRGGPSSIGVLRYDSNVFAGFELMEREKARMQGTSGAQPSLAGEPITTKRQSATEFAELAQAAGSRPEFAAVLLEKDFLPLVGQSILRRYQQFLLDTDDLALRVGEIPEGEWIGNILGDFDVQFIGSRMAMSRQQKLQGYDRLFALLSVLPQLQLMLPVQEIGMDIIGNVLELEDIAAKMGPQNAQLNALLGMVAGMNGSNNNGAATSAAPAGQLPAQAGGSELG